MSHTLTDPPRDERKERFAFERSDSATAASSLQLSLIACVFDFPRSPMGLLILPKQEIQAPTTGTCTSPEFGYWEKDRTNFVGTSLSIYHIATALPEEYLDANALCKGFYYLITKGWKAQKLVFPRLIALYLSYWGQFLVKKEKANHCWKRKERSN